ncbi:hypothetical conserved integral membrane protein [Corynebacterium flavescens]|uniref:Hypothetical conserved integral membrane protein n=1 Tax=Corynebacterium flavescens TaxID=28028 RepID=A0AB73B428_CORFL|nr:hypothetical conserved integral membrane protein [Corynebacterium flavescens]
MYVPSFERPHIPVTSFLIFLHVIAALLLIGPVCVSTSTYQSQMLKASQGDVSALGAARLLHNITSTYGYISAIVPILGISVFLADLSTYKSEIQFHIAILVAIVAWCLLFFLIIPKQKKSLAALEENSGEDFAATKKSLAAMGGIFNLLWVICACLMFV